MSKGWFRGDGDDDGFLGSALYGGAVGVLEHLSDDVLQVHGHRGKGGVGLAIDDELGARAIAQLANVGNELRTRLDSGGRAERGVDDADVGRMLWAGGRASIRVEMLLTAKVQSDMLLGDQAGADSSAKVVVEEACNLLRGDIPAALQKSLGEDGDGVGVGSNELGESLCEADLVYRAPCRCGVPVREEYGEGVKVVAVDAGDIGIGDDDVREIAEGLDTVGEANGEEREGKVGGGEEGALGEGRAAVSGKRKAVSSRERDGRTVKAGA